MSDGNGAAQDENRIESLLDEMTLEEKVSVLAGASNWYTAPIERLGIPAIKVTDGPNGARGAGAFAGGVTSACFPVGIALAATWNLDLVYRVGQALAEEAGAKGAQFLLAPTVNIHRSPLNGRNFECYSEDPYLSSRMAVAYIGGLQSEGIGATVKHFVANDSEFERNSISSDVGERALREIYLPAFRAAVQEGKSWAVMAAYNKVNGTFAAENSRILQDILKNEWGFDGIVMSDWWGTKSTVAAANNGLDLEMPGPPAWRGEKLVQAVQSGEVNPEAIDEAARRMLRAIMRTGAFDQKPDHGERAEDLPGHRALIREAAGEAAVLLKNDGNVLPVNLERVTSIAVIGPNAKTAQIMGGGSAQVNAHYGVTPYDGIMHAVGDRAQVRYALGCTNHKLMPMMGALVPDSFRIEYFANQDLSGNPVFTAHTRSSEQMWWGGLPEGIDRRNFSARMTGTFVPDESGTYSFGLTSGGLSRLFVDGTEVIDNWTQQTPGDSFWGGGSTEATGQIEAKAGDRRELRLDYTSRGARGALGLRLGYLPPMADDLIREAEQVAAESEVALVFVGLTGEWESEGVDRPDMELVGRQNELVERIAGVNPNTVVVLQTGSPVTMPWLGDVAAVVEAWYPGQECGNAIADVLFGAVTPSGKLPQTFPRRLEDNPAFINYPGENGHVHYGEGIFVGYRYYDKKDVDPLFPFGFGLSYTTFEYGDVAVSSDTMDPDGSLTLSLQVTNTGERAGKEVVQLYLRDPASSLARPPKELKGFAKIALEPGEQRTVEIVIDRTALAYWDDARESWVAEAGEFEALVGSSSRDIRGRATFGLTRTAMFGGGKREREALSSRSLIKALLDDEAAVAVVERHLPGFSQHPMLGMAGGMSLHQVAGFAPEMISEEVLRAIDEDLATLT
jgi:beta-glucosidase